MISPGDRRAVDRRAWCGGIAALPAAAGRPGRAALAGAPRFAAALRQAGRLDRLHGLLVARQGEIAAAEAVRGHAAACARGHDGQMLDVVPSLELTVVVTRIRCVRRAPRVMSATSTP
ncbi:MAG: hypothetical protein AB7I59_23645 [Geminicoccaceae bacterium]